MNIASQVKRMEFKKHRWVYVSDGMKHDTKKTTPYIAALDDS